MLSNYFSKKQTGIDAFIDKLAAICGTTPKIQTLPARAAQPGTFGKLDGRIVSALKARGVEALYSHQGKAVELALAHRDFVIATPTASGKTFCYNLPVINEILHNPLTRALYIFPTKALAQDQLAELTEIAAMAECKINSFVYDGDTSSALRRAAKTKGSVIITNPDMLNSGILPHHTKWSDYFSNLKYIVVDELHTYRGVFGSHMANLFARLARICEFYGSHPAFICCSATISNPKEHAEALTCRNMELIKESGAPSSEKKIFIYNPPLVDKNRGIRRSSLFEASRIAAEALGDKISTIVFTRSRLNVELLLRQIRKELARRGENPEIVMGYRGGYLPNERRKIEHDLRSGALRGVVSTNALELGIDIGSLGLAVLHGYPGTIASTLQQMGRAGRRDSLSAAVMVATMDPLDQFLAARPDWFFGNKAEAARIDPNNPYISMSHLKCSLFELPMSAHEKFRGEDMADYLEYLEDNGVANKSCSCEDEKYYWQADDYPASDLSMRSAVSENYTITDITLPGKPVIIGTMDRPSAATLIFPEAIYMHGDKTYIVESLDTEKMQCFIKEIASDYYTDGDAALRVDILDTFDTQHGWGWGEVKVTLTPTVFKKIKFSTHENVGYGKISLPEEQMHTTACWIFMPVCREEDASLKIAMEGLEYLLRNTAPLFLMCDRNDIKVKSRLKDPQLERAAVFIIDSTPGGIGLAEGAYEVKEKLLTTAYSMLKTCPCQNGCPACTGVLMTDDFNVKQEVEALIEQILRGD